MSSCIVAGRTEAVRCHWPQCTVPAYELEPGLPTLFCAEHRAAVTNTTPPLPGLLGEQAEQGMLELGT